VLNPRETLLTVPRYTRKVLFWNR